MNLINYPPKIKLTVGIIVIILFIATYAYLFPKEFIFSCSGFTEEAMYTNEKEPTLINSKNRDEFEKIVKVKKYFEGYFFTINNYSIFQCSKITPDLIFCYQNTEFSKDSDDFDLIRVRHYSATEQKIDKNIKTNRFYTEKCELKENIFK